MEAHSSRTDFLINVTDITDEDHLITSTSAYIKIAFKYPTNSAKQYDIGQFCFKEPIIDREPKPAGIWSFDLTDNSKVEIYYEDTKIISYNYKSGCTAANLVTNRKVVTFTENNEQSIFDRFTTQG